MQQLILPGLEVKEKTKPNPLDQVSKNFNTIIKHLKGSLHFLLNISKQPIGQLTCLNVHLGHFSFNF